MHGAMTTLLMLPPQTKTTRQWAARVIAAGRDRTRGGEVTGRGAIQSGRHGSAAHDVGYPTRRPSDDGW